MRRTSARTLLGTALGLSLIAVAAAPVAASKYPVTYVNANFGTPNSSNIAFYRSRGSLNFDSATAQARAKSNGNQVSFSASADNDASVT